MMKECKDYSFRDQIQRAAVSIMNNIAEGFDSGSDARYASFLNISGVAAQKFTACYTCVKTLNYVHQKNALTYKHY